MYSAANDHFALVNVFLPLRVSPFPRGKSVRRESAVYEGNVRQEIFLMQIFEVKPQLSSGQQSLAKSETCRSSALERGQSRILRITGEKPSSLLGFNFEHDAGEEQQRQQCR